MRLEDAFIYLMIEAPPDMGLAAFCEAAVAGGADVIHLGPSVAAEASSVLDVCRRTDALLVIADDAAAARETGADGVALMDASTPVGQARAAMGPEGLVGVSARTDGDVQLALEMEVDFLIHWIGPRCAATFASVPGATGSVRFVAGLNSLEDARMTLDGGICRLCLDASLVAESENPSEALAAFSRLLGRAI